MSRLDFNPTQRKARRDEGIPSPRAVRRSGIGKHDNACGAEHPQRKDGLGNALKCNRTKGHKAKQHKARTKSGEVWWT